MPVAVDPGYAERNWTGVETDFGPAMVALTAAHVAVKYRSAAGVVTTLTPGAHLSITKAGDVDVVGAISSAPIAMPAAPGVVIFARTTPASNDADFDNLEGYEPSVHTRLADAAALRDAELLGRQARAITPFSVTGDLVDFRPRRVQAADPIEDQDLATKAWVLVTTGIGSILAYVEQAAASALAAANALASVLMAKADAETARDAGQVSATASANSAAASLASASLADELYDQITNAARDWGDFQGTNTIATDWGTFT